MMSIATYHWQVSYEDLRSSGSQDTLKLFAVLKLRPSINLVFHVDSYRSLRVLNQILWSYPPLPLRMNKLVGAGSEPNTWAQSIQVSGRGKLGSALCFLLPGYDTFVSKTSKLN